MNDLPDLGRDGARPAVAEANSSGPPTSPSVAMNRETSEGSPRAGYRM